MVLKLDNMSQGFIYGSRGCYGYNQIQRNLSSCSNDVEAKCYKTKSLVSPQLEYGATIWDPYTYTNSTEVEAVQGRAARFCFNNYRQIRSGSSMMQDLGSGDVNRTKQ